MLCTFLALGAVETIACPLLFKKNNTAQAKRSFYYFYPRSFITVQNHLRSFYKVRPREDSV